MSRWLAIGLAITSLMALLACGGGSETTAPAAAPATDAAAAPVAAPGTAPSGIAVGASVAAPWGSAGSLYLGTVTAIAGSSAKVLYADDNITRDVEVAQLVPVISRTWQVNDKVLAVWSSGKFYSGVITAVTANGYTVKWDDGSAPSEVVAGKIIAPPAAGAAAAATVATPVAAAAGSWQVGNVVEVLWNGAWYKAKILEIKDGKYKITYDGYGSSWDEFVGPDRIRAVQAQ